MAKNNLKIKKNISKNKKNMELKIKNRGSLDKRNKQNRCQSPLGSFEHRWVPRDEEVTVHWRTQIYVVHVLTQQGEGSQRHSLKQITGRTAPLWKRAQKNVAHSPGKRQGSLLSFCCSHGKGCSEKFLTLSLLKGQVWRFKMFTQGTEIPTLISDLWSHQSLQLNKGQPNL